MGTVTIQVRDFMLDEKKLERFSFSKTPEVRISFNFDVLKQGNITKGINVIFKTALEAKILDGDAEEESISAEALVEMQVAAYIEHIEMVDFDNPIQEHLDIAIASLYPVSRSVIANDLHFIKLDHNVLPFSIE